MLYILFEHTHMRVFMCHPVSALGKHVRGMNPCLSLVTTRVVRDVHRRHAARLADTSRVDDSDDSRSMTVIFYRLVAEL